MIVCDTGYHTTISHFMCIHWALKIIIRCTENRGGTHGSSIPTVIMSSCHFREGPQTFPKTFKLLFTPWISCSKEAIIAGSSLHSLKLTFSFDFQCVSTILLPVVRASFTQEHTCEDRLASFGKIPRMHNAGPLINSVSSMLLTHFTKADQKSCTISHSYSMWINVPLCLVHLQQLSSSLSPNLDIFDRVQ